jgi:antibiotic biosynthesis monooxygenase (ABM) superfamily enzyme
MDQNQLDPVSIVFRRVVKPERAAEFEGWLRELDKVLHQFEGYLGLDVIRPQNHNHPEYAIIMRFDTVDHLRVWELSTERREWVEKSADLTVGEATIQRRQGADIWFTSTEQGSAAPRPARYKTTLLTIAGIYPVLVIISYLLAPLLVGLHPLLSSFIMVVFIAPIVTHVVMPLLTRIFHGWLYPQPPAARV